MSIKITNNVTYVGQIDWSTRHFHGEQLTTNHGTTYNSYLIKCEKTVLLDTVYGPFSNDLLARLEQNGGIEKLDYIVVLHGEPDHSQALGRIMALRPELPIYCTASGVKSIKGYFHKEWNFNVVKTGDKLDLGGGSLTFVEVPMLHWPDQLIAYFDKDKMLFSSDLFGAHYCNQHIFSETADKSALFGEAVKYYANIVAPYSSIAKNKLKDLAQLNFEIKFIAPSHGVIWNEKDAQKIIKKYVDWSAGYKENLITIAFDTMYESTRKMANAIAEGIAIADKHTTINLFYTGTADMSDVITSIFCSKGFIAGSPTYNSGILHSMAGLLDELRGLRLTGKKAAAFGSYGWAPVNVKILTEMLEKDGFELPDVKTIATNWNPDVKQLDLCHNYGAYFADWCK